MKRCISLLLNVFHRVDVLLLVITLAAFACPRLARGVTPPPDGGYPNENTAEGDDALFSLTSGSNNTAVGFEALFNNTTGDENTATGSFALYSNTSGVNAGSANTATGYATLLGNTEGYQNTATGWQALFSNTTGADNTATGISALLFNTTGIENTATGASALGSNTTGNFNIATGTDALASNTTGSNNTASGFNALYSNKRGNYNAATGQGSLYHNTTGVSNTADGQNALQSNTTGSFNIAVGANAGHNLTTGSNNIEVGNPGVAGEANTIRVGKVGTQTATFITGISGVTVAGGVGVIVDTNGHLGTVMSSARFKDEIKPMDRASEAILALKPVTFHYKHKLDPDGIPQFGLVAEQVEKVNPYLVARDSEGKAYTVRYEAVNAMLLNEFLKEHAKVDAQEQKLESLEQTVSDLKAAMKEQARGTPNKF